MGLSNDILSQLAKVVKDDKKQKTESIVYGTVKTDADGNKYVQLDGSDQLTPLSDTNQPTVEDSMATVKEKDRVSVLIKNHTATIIGNMSSPSVGQDDVEKSIANFDIAIGEQIQANRAYFKELIGDNVNVNNLTAAIISVIDLVATEAEIEDLIAGKITVTDLIADKIDADVVIADKAIVEKLQSSNIDVLSLIADKAVIKDLIANNADLDSLEAKNAYLKYATVDFANIGEAAIKKLFTESGIIKDLVVSEGHITGELVGVTIKGSLIEAGTLVADKLVVRGENGIYYKLNLDAGVISSEEVSEEDLQNGLHGDTIIAKTITAEKVNVDDLVAFGATIGGFEITDDSIHTVDKDSINNTTPGIYLDNEGQAYFGDGNRYLKFFKGTDGKYKLNILADELRFAASGKTVEETINGISIGSRNLLRYTGDLPITYDLTTGIGSYGTAQPLEDTGDGVKFTVPEGGKGGMSLPLIYDSVIRNGEEITISFDYRGNMTDLGAFYFLQRTTPNVSTNIFPDAIVSEEEWQHYKFTFSSNYANDRVCYAALLFYMGSTEAGKWIEIKKGSLKLERGNKATDWSPAIEDMVGTDDLNNTRSEITRYVSEQVSNINTTTGEITASVTKLKDEITGQLDETIDNIERLQEKVDLKMSSEDVKIEIQKIVDNGTSRVDTGTGFTFNDEGLTIDKKDSEGNPISQTNTKITENGMTVNSYTTGKAVLTANKDGVDAENLHATTYLIINGKSRFENYKVNGENRIGCFWIG